MQGPSAYDGPAPVPDNANQFGANLLAFDHLDLRPPNLPPRPPPSAGGLVAAAAGAATGGGGGGGAGAAAAVAVATGGGFILSTLVVVLLCCCCLLFFFRGESRAGRGGRKERRGRRARRAQWQRLCDGGGARGLQHHGVWHGRWPVERAASPARVGLDARQEQGPSSSLAAAVRLEDAQCEGERVELLGANDRVGVRGRTGSSTPSEMSRER